MRMKNLIITADDFGVFPAINEGVYEALKARKINSVAAFANFEGKPATAASAAISSSVENARELHNRFGDNVDIGCHLTITSGKPVTGDKIDFMCNAGYFRDYTEILFFRSPAQLKLLEEELCAQVDQLVHTAGVPVKHLTCHHNSLCLIEEYFHVYLEVARKFKLPMRSVNVRPEKENNLYLKHIYRKLRDDMPAEDRHEVLRYKDIITHCFGEHCDGVRSPDRVDSTHYGPVGLFPGLFVGLLKGLFAWNKNRQLKNMLEEFEASEERHLELMLHLGNNKNKHITQQVSTMYPGVAPNYFDSRAAELKSILKYAFENHQEINRNGWRAL